MHRRAGFTEVHLASTLDHVREIYTPLAEDKHITFSFEIAPDVPTVRGDPNLLLEAVSNIVDNAIKFTPAGGSIHLRLMHGRRSRCAHRCDRQRPGHSNVGARSGPAAVLSRHLQ